MKNYKRMRVAELKTEMHRVEDAMRSAIAKDYPGLLQWLLPPPHWKPTKAKMLRWLEEAPKYAAGRISGAYGIGRGGDWYRKHMEAIHGRG
jgi:hypothetical protein